jgi:predicted transcriptional regulator
VAKQLKCGYCGGIIAYEPYLETIGGKKYAFHAEQCAVAFRARKCGYCGGVIVYEPYVETIGKKEMTFHAKACADAYKNKPRVTA